jgi:hypothetical protein
MRPEEAEEAGRGRGGRKRPWRPEEAEEAGRGRLSRELAKSEPERPDRGQEQEDGRTATEGGPNWTDAGPRPAFDEG